MAQATWMVTKHEHVGRSPALESDLTGDLVHDPDLAIFNQLVGVRQLSSYF